MRSSGSVTCGATAFIPVFGVSALLLRFDAAVGDVGTAFLTG